jgi:hypothetical protein
MALVLADRVKETTTVAGTGTATLLGAATGYRSFSVVGNANTTYYCIAGQGTAEWEVGIGTYTLSGTTLARTTVLSSSNAGALVSFSAGTKDVFVTYPSGKSVYQDASGNVGVGTSTNTNTSAIYAYGTISETVGTTQYLVASQYDVGTAPNQLPLNQYLGALAYLSRPYRKVQRQLATSLQTVFTITGNYAPGYIDVYQNGVKLYSSDYTETNVSTITLTTGAALNDEIEFVIWWV